MSDTERLACITSDFHEGIDMNDMNDSNNDSSNTWTDDGDLFVPVRQSLSAAVVGLSVADHWALARLEWVVGRTYDAGRGEDALTYAECVCGQTGLRYLHDIVNVNNGAELGPIGSDCIEKFRSEAMATAVRRGREIARLRGLVAHHTRLELGHLSRSTIDALHAAGILPDREAAFVLAMFNRRRRMTPRQAAWLGNILCRGRESVRGQLTVKKGGGAA